MQKPTSLHNYVDYTLALLWLMERIGQDRIDRVRREFKQQFGHLIPEEDYAPLKSGEETWSNTLAWSRQHLIDLKLMRSGGYGIWVITEEGRQWLHTHSNPGIAREDLQQLLSAYHQEWLANKDKTKRKRQSVSQTSNGKPEKRTFDAKPEKRPSSQQARVNGVNETERLHKLLDKRLKDIHYVLEGRSTVRPTDEVLCDWVLFCYDFELYAEGAQLFALINSSQVNDWLYRRARKLAQACKVKQMHVQGE